MLAYKFCSSTHSVYTHMYSYVVDSTEFHLCFEILVLVSFYAFHKIRENMQIILILNMSVFQTLIIFPPIQMHRIY